MLSTAAIFFSGITEVNEAAVESMAPKASG
jgi:hypothetical protein